MCFFTLIQFISHWYKLHTPQGVHVTNIQSNLAFWYNENPAKKNMLYFGIETVTSKSKYFFLQDSTFPNWINPLEKGMHVSVGLLQHFKEQSGL